jgi:ornithine cyclodeaminase/alanine dehydrogenase-like protein (mu-crystallin family)
MFDDGRMVETLTDADVTARVTSALAVETMREAVLAAHRGELVAPARTLADLDEGRLLFTAGRWRGRWYGFRAYDTFDHDSASAHDDQLVVVHDDSTGRLLGIVVGAELGRRRTGAIGGVAADALAAAGASTLGMVGTGHQAWAQLWAISAVRRLETVRVYSRDEGRRRAFADRAGAELGIAATASDSARDAVTEAAVAVLATNSAEPVVDVDWLAGGCHVTAVGPKQQGRSEYPTELLDTASTIVTDSQAQLRGYDPPALAAVGRHADRVQALGTVVAGAAPGRRRDSDRTVYLSVGLAGTEVALAARLLT